MSDLFVDDKAQKDTAPKSTAPKGMAANDAAAGDKAPDDTAFSDATIRDTPPAPLPASDLTQIVYVSRSTFTTMPAELGIEPSVARILAQSRVNNARRGLVGALYFGDGCFFQCLEGRTAEVDRLYAILLKDPRHTDLQVLSRRAIPHTSFSTWAMKYVPLDAEMKALMRELGMDRFDPYRFAPATVARVLDMLAAGGDIGLDAADAAADVSGASSDSTPAPPASAPAASVAHATGGASGARWTRLAWGIGIAAALAIAAAFVFGAFG